ncbi:MAG: ATP-binding cassette domain-containing protein [Planctomycetota bacterium]
MSVLLVTGLKKILGAREVLAGADLRIEAGERVGCVGRNGEGKTTLLRILEGEVPHDGGEVIIAKRARLGYVKQRPDFQPGETVRGYVEAGLEEVHRVERELEALGESMGSAEGEELDRQVRRHGELSERMEFLGGWDAERRIETVLSGIGLPERFWEREAATLSGGEKSRTTLARELVSVPDLLLLDEPTNHLDLAGIEWLESYLQEIHSAVLLVSHDRRLLDRACDAIIELERGRIARYPGNYGKYIELKEEQYRVDLRAYEMQQDFLRKEDAFIKKHMGSQRTGEAKGRRKKLAHVERLERPYHDVRSPDIRMASTARGGELVLEAEGLRLGYDDASILAGADVRIGRGERIGIVGPNGSGKTTLMKALADRLNPLGGTIERGHKAACGFYDQETTDLREDSTIYGEIRRDHPRMTDEEVRKHLARFLFRGGDVEKEVRSLSGGERARVALARLVLTGPSWLALDEPTNHLDLAGRTALEEMLGHFDGALVCISHDRAFLDGLCTTILEVRDGAVRRFDGNYSEYRQALLDEEAQRMEAAGRKRAEEKKARRQEEEKRKKQAAKAAASGAKPASKSKKKKNKNPYLLKKIESAIIALEEERETLLAELGTEEVYRDPEALKERQYRLAEVERDLAEKNLEWEEWV